MKETDQKHNGIQNKLVEAIIKHIETKQEDILTYMIAKRNKFKELQIVELELKRRSNQT
jgi:hypothetical protein